MRQLDESMKKTNNPNASGFFDRVKSFWDRVKD